MSVSIDPLHPSSNRLSGYSYDASGNMLNDGTNNYTFNAESEMTTAAGVTYTYDGDGNRVQKATTGTPPAPPTPYKLYWTGGGSDPLDETDASGNLTNEYIFFGGKRIARRDPANNVDYYFADNLGTARIVTNASGTIQDDSDFYPFGGERPYLSLSGNTYKFTGKMRDTESGLDDFDARYYSSALGRFVSADWSATPEPVPYADFTDPQSLNLYTYVRNVPTTNVDADGHVDWDTVGKVLQFLGGVAQGIAGSMSQGTAPAAEPSPGDSTTQRLGQVAGTVAVGAVGAAATIAGGGEVAGGLAACSTGAGCAAGAPAIVQGTATAVVGATATVGAIRYGVDLAKTSHRSSSAKDEESSSGQSGNKEKPDTRATKAEKNTPGGAREQRESITNAKRKKNIASTKKSEQRETNANKKWYKSSQDLPK